MFNFNETIDRRHTNCVKWDTVETSYHEKDLLPLWVADMDFKVHQPILDALSQVIEQGILGYAVAPNDLYQAIQDWQRQHHQLIVEKEEILFNSGVVPSLATAVQAYTAPADSVMICDPVYPPFADVVKQNERRLVRHSLLEVNGHYEVDLVKMEQQIIEEKVKLLLFCNPHNPGGRVWTKEELLAIGRLCQKHQVTVVSDEIHQDLIFKPHTFTSFTVADEAFKEFTVTLTAATKTFNMEPEGTYLLWLDFSSYSLTDRELRDTLIHKGKVVLNPGISFGPQGSQHMRLNLACSKETLEEGLLRIKKAFN
ncbi:aminotransferase class I/II-fold pyridoxal phosphate-dependent enzyme [Enterococcus faecalis]|nr:aminotransferase class I/II-fold pyridoxal phosphate-dependent enzyme [Enterococcus faecalis]